MGRAEHVSLMARYNEWMNGRLYEAVMGLPDEQIGADNKAFFGSLLGTLNHLVVADTIWLKRFLSHPTGWSQLEPLRTAESPVALNQILYTDIRSLHARRIVLDSIILQWTAVISEHDLDQTIAYKSMKGIPSERNLFSLLMHVFNHQTHHRGQATTLLNQYGVDIGVTDLVAITPDLVQK